jgi:hypothetical protein
MIPNPMRTRRVTTKKLANALKWTDVYHWLVGQGYFPESYVLPPCFTVKKRPNRPRLFATVTNRGKKFSLTPRECCNVHFPKSDLADRTFGIIHPELHNDIAYHLARNWKTVVSALLPSRSAVTCYSFPVPIGSKQPGRMGRLRSGRMIYQFLRMTEDDLASVAYRFTHVVRTDIVGPT